MKLSRTRFAATWLALAAWLPLAANAGILEDDEARRAIIAIDGQMKTLTRLVTALTEKIDTKSDKSAGLDFLNQIEQTTQEIASLRGQVEELTNLVETERKNGRTLYADIDARIKHLEQQQAIDGKVSDGIPGEAQSVEKAHNLFRSGDYDGAARTFADFVKRYPSSTYAPSAQHWLGNAYFALGDYKRAIAAQEVVAKIYKNSAEAPEAMLNIASSYTELKDKNAARKTLQQLIKTFPGSSVAPEAKLRLADLK